MAKPGWLKEREAEHRKFRRCMTCRHAGPAVGQTNYLGSGVGRLTMYQCSLHPTIRFWRETYACEDWERRML
jgi:hypothetical protein